MMICPETYYEMNLKGRTPNEIMKSIRSLKRDINSLKKQIEHPSDYPEDLICPSRLTRLKMSRDYFERAIEAYEEAGGTYVPTKAEQRAVAFDADLDSISRLVFEIGGFFGGYEKRTYTISDDRVGFDAEHSLYPKPTNLPACFPFTKKEFIDGLKGLHIGEWKRSYNDPHILDGTQWGLEFHYNGDRPPVVFDGSNAYPYNFEDLLQLLGTDETIASF